MERIDIGLAIEFAEGVPMWFVPPGSSTAVIVCRVEGQLQAVVDRCSHQERSMVHGRVAHGMLQCPHHGVCYRLASGEVVKNRGYRGLLPLQTLRVDEEDGRAWLYWQPAAAEAAG